eukprot:gene9014-biopygen8897
MDDLKFRDVEKKRLRYKFVRTRDELQSMTFTIASMMVPDEGVVAVVVICNPKSDRYNVTITKALKLYDIVGSTLTVRPGRRRAAVYTSQTLAFSSSRSQSQMVVNAGDYVVQETDGVGYYIVNKETFEDTYEFVPDNIPTMLAGFVAKTLCLRNTDNSKVVRKSFTVICEMLVDRGETLSIEETAPIALDLHARAVTPSSGGVFHVDLPGDCGYRVIYSLNQTFKLPDVRKLLAPLENNVGKDAAVARRNDDEDEDEDFVGDIEEDDVIMEEGGDTENDNNDINEKALSEADSYTTKMGGGDSQNQHQQRGGGGINNIREVILVTREKVFSTSRRGLDESVRRHVQFFCLSELQFNISCHELVPRHEPIRDEHVIEQLVARYRVKSRYHFPIIVCSEPMARYLDLRPGHLVRIVRFSPDVGMYAPYRCCAVANTHTTAPPEETLKNS